MCTYSSSIPSGSWTVALFRFTVNGAPGCSFAMNASKCAFIYNKMLPPLLLLTLGGIAYFAWSQTKWILVLALPLLYSYSKKAGSPSQNPVARVTGG